MRTIKFRGKRVDNGEWVYGNLTNSYTDSDPLNESSEITVNICIQEFPIDYNKSRLTIVIPETVGQFTGLTDKNGKDIFEGDVLKVSLFKKTFQVVFAESEKWGASFQHKSHNSIFYLTKYFTDTSEVIGNIHDNPELL